MNVNTCQKGVLVGDSRPIQFLKSQEQIDVVQDVDDKMVKDLLREGEHKMPPPLAENTTASEGNEIREKLENID